MHVVVVAATAALRNSLMTMLAQRGHEIQPFSDPVAALRYLEENRQANALLIVGQFAHMPAMEISWEARLLASAERPIYIGLVSRPMSLDRLIEALDCGADDVLEMPLSAEVLFARLRAAQRLADMQRRLVEMATTDALTGLLNRRAFFERAKGLLQAGAGGISATMVDIDHFKRVNDLHGHAAGDAALCFVAGQLRDEDAIVGRLGGEEFAILHANSEIESSVMRSERLRERIANGNIDLGGGAQGAVSCSFGVAARHPGDDIDRLLRKADLALYAAKTSGRNRVVTFDPAMSATSRAEGGTARAVTRLETVSEALDELCLTSPVFLANCI
jgi:diguanylate cyclase (GGDEF)-like protein